MLYAWLMVASFWAGLASPSPLGLQPAPDWILEVEEPPTPARRITPKSVFVAPTFSECDQGFRHDPVAGRCVRIIKVNQKAQWDFFLSRLNAMYAQPTKQKVQSGPLHLALPLDPIPATTKTTQTVPPTTTTFPSTTPSPTTFTETSPTTTNVPVTTTPQQTTITSTQPSPTTTATETLPTTTNQPSPNTSTQPQITTTTEQSSTSTIPPSTSTISSTFPSTPPTTYFTESSMDTTFPFSTTESSNMDFTDESTFPSSTFSTFSTGETTETYTEYSTLPEPQSVPSNQRRVYHSATIKPKPKCSPTVKQVGEYNPRDSEDCETETIQPQYIRFPNPTIPPRRKMGYVRFPDRTWQSSYWWPHSTWDQRRVPLPSSYQKVQHYPSWQRGRPIWAETPSL